MPGRVDDATSLYFREGQNYCNFCTIFVGGGNDRSLYLTTKDVLHNLAGQLPVCPPCMPALAQ